MLRYGVFFAFFFTAFVIFGQEQQLDTIHISTKSKLPPLFTVSSKEVALYQANDLGEVLQKIPGMSVKNYGGMGGMKTVSVRGLGSAHQQIVIDGFLTPNTQTGQIDLGNIYASNIESVQLISGGFTDQLLPVSARIGANVLWIDRFEAQFPNKRYAFKSKISYGSFNTMDVWLSNKIRLAKRHALSIGGSFQTSDGNYPYRFQNYSQLYTGKRVNAAVLSGNANAVYQWKISEKIQAHLDYSFFKSDKGLPGPVILYLNAAQQNLATTTHQGNLGVTFSFPSWKGRFYGTYKNELTKYVDNGYLNTQGKLENNYHQQQFFGGWVMNQSLGKYLKQEFGVEGFWAKLTGDISQDVQPQRYQLKGFYGFGPTFSWGEFRAQIAGQTLSDYNRSSPISKGKIYLQPSFYFNTSKDWKVIGDLQFFYKRSVRVAGFNELYYNQVGNKNVLPEIADQFQLSFSKTYAKNKMKHLYGANVYYNQERNKIVAIPTKNLFVWMIQNVGKAQVLGADLSYRYIQYWNNWNTSVSVNYTYQSVTDRTYKQTTIYGNQLAYFPEHIGNFDVAVNWKNAGMAVNVFAVSKRYALNENIPTNEVSGYVTADVQLSYKFTIKDQHQLTVRAMCKNIGNLTYAYVKYYVMPGTNYLLVLNYEF